MGPVERGRLSGATQEEEESLLCLSGRPAVVHPAGASSCLGLPKGCKDVAGQGFGGSGGGLEAARWLCWLTHPLPLPAFYAFWFLFCF